MKIYNRNTGYVYYDNQPGSNDASDPVTAVGTNSSIVIQGAQPSSEPLTESDKTSVQAEQEKLVRADKLELLAFPNPSSQHFSVQLKTNDHNTKLQLQVFDQQGRLLERRDNLQPGSVIQLGEKYRPGMYVVRVIQGRQQTEVKLVKL